MIPVSPEAITYRPQKTEVPKQTELYRLLDLNTNFIRGDKQIVFSWDLISISLVRRLQLQLAD